MMEVPGGSSMRMTLNAARATGSGLAKRIFAGGLIYGAAAVATLGAQQSTESVGGEASLKLPDLSSVTFLGIDGHRLLVYGIAICVFGLLFGMTIFNRLKNLPVHR